MVIVCKKTLPYMYIAYICCVIVYYQDPIKVGAYKSDYNYSSFKFVMTLEVILPYMEGIGIRT